MSFLCQPLQEKVEYGGKVYRVCTAFDVVLDVQKIYREDKLSDQDKFDLVTRLLCPDKKLRFLSVKERLDLLEMIFDKCIKTRPRPRVGKQVRVVDFYEDGEYIYASFVQDYGIDLIDQQGKLPWKKFIALFQGLSETTKIKQIMQIRGRDIPAPTKHNQEEIKNLMELKAYYALGYRENNVKDGIELLFSTLEGMAT